MGANLRAGSARDLLFVAETLVPERGDREHLVALLQEDETLLEAMLQDDRLFQQIMAEEEIFPLVSPHFFFKVLLLRTRRDLETASYTIERRHLQKVALFDADQVVELLSQPGVADYLASMLASFTRINSITIPVRVRKGLWRRIRINDLDVDSLARYAQALEEEHRFWAYQRIGDACLFLTGIFPEYIDARQRYPLSGAPRLRMRSSLVNSLEDYEAFGRTFYRLAAEHAVAQLQGVDEILTVMSERFILAEKPLNFVAEHYLSLRKDRLFEV
jgi:hypothetical protein